MGKTQESFIYKGLWSLFDYVHLPKTVFPICVSFWEEVDITDLWETKERHRGWREREVDDHTGMGRVDIKNVIQKV